MARQPLLRIAAVVILLGLGSAVAPAAMPAHATSSPAYKLTALPSLDALGPSFIPVGLTKGGTILGYTKSLVSTAAGGEDYLTHIYLLKPGGKLHELLQPKGISNFFPTAINDHGEVVGESATTSSYLAFVYRAGTWTQLADGAAADPTAINNHGQITGYAPANGGNYAFLADDRGDPLHVLGTLPCGCATFGEAISPHGVIVGRASDPNNNWYPVLFPAGGGAAHNLASILSGAGAGEESAINAHDVAAGIATVGGINHLTRYDGAMHDLGALADWSILSVKGIDEGGRIVGVAGRVEHSVLVTRALVADTGGAHDLTTLAGLASPAVIETAIAANAGGDILARADLGHGLVTVLLTPVTGTTAALLSGGATGFPPVTQSAEALQVQTKAGKTTYTCPYFGYSFAVTSDWSNMLRDLGDGSGFCDPQAPVNYVSPYFFTTGSLNSWFYIMVFRHTTNIGDAMNRAMHQVFQPDDWPTIHLVGGKALGNAPPPLTILHNGNATWTMTTLDSIYTGSLQPLSARQIIIVTRAPDGYVWALQGRVPLSLLQQQMPWLQAVITSFRPLPGSPFETASTAPTNAKIV